MPTAVRFDELPEESRLADAGLADDRDNLTVARLSLLEPLRKLRQFLAPGHERCQPLAQPQPRSLETYKAARCPRCSVACCAGDDDETALEEWARRLADDHGPGLGTHHERLQLLPRRTFRRVLDPRRAAYPADQDLADVQTNADSRRFR